MRPDAIPMRKSKQRFREFAIPGLFLMLLIPGGVWAQSITDDGIEYLDVDVATLGVDLRTGAPLALLHADWEQVLPIWIGEVEAQAIARARQGVEWPRPQTHDLLASVLASLGGTLEEIRVYELRENTYFGALRIRTADGIREVDSRPSDALALAVRTGARIRVATRLVTSSAEVDFLSAEGERAIARIRGITVTGPTDEERSRFDLPMDRDGLLVLHAESAIGARGVRRGDLILQVRDQEIGSAVQFLEMVGSQPATSPLELRIIRDGAEQDVEVPPLRPPGRVSWS